jgi:hypothetical protein
MPRALDPFRFILLAVAGLMNQRQLQGIEYLREENRLLRKQLDGRRVRLNDDSRASASPERRLPRKSRAYCLESLGRRQRGLPKTFGLASSDSHRKSPPVRVFGPFPTKTRSLEIQCHGSPAHRASRQPCPGTRVDGERRIVWWVAEDDMIERIGHGRRKQDTVVSTRQRGKALEETRVHAEHARTPNDIPSGIALAADVVGRNLERSFDDGSGIRHSVQVMAESLFEAAAFALHLFEEAGRSARSRRSSRSRRPDACREARSERSAGA